MFSRSPVRLAAAGGGAGVSTDYLIDPDMDLPKEIIFEDKVAAEQLKLIAQLNDKDRKTFFSIIETMLTKQKFSDFFKENIKA